MASYHDQVIKEGAGQGRTSGATSDNGDIMNQSQIRWEYEEVKLERGSTGLGFTVAGGIDNPHYKNDNSIYITRIIPNGPAALNGRLKLEDIIVRVNNIDLINVKHSEAVAALKNSTNSVQLLIKRKKPFETTTITKNNSITNVNNNNTINKNNINNSTTGLYTAANLKSPQQSNNNFHKNNNATRLFTSTLSNAHVDQLHPLPLGVQTNNNSTLLRGSAHYSTTREGHPSSSSRLKGASSSLSLHQADELETARSYNLFSKENNSLHSKSTSAIDHDVTRLPRTVILQRSSKGLGFNIVGGVAGGGTFISYIVPGGTADRSKKLHCGDQILSVNGTNLRFATHEEAATSLKQAGQTVKLVVKYNPDEYIKFENKINDLREQNMLSTGTLKTSQKRSLHARALFDYDPSKDSGLPSKGLPFKFGDILHITNASDDEWWQAKKVLESGVDDTVLGIIPSKKRIEKRERARLRSVKFTYRNGSESMLDRRKKKFSFSKKFPFMKSRENIGEFDEYETESQMNSRAILSSSSTTSINNNSEKGNFRNDSEEVIPSYEPVLQQDINYTRPIAIYGPIKDDIETLRDELCCDERFCKMEQLVPYTTRPPKEGEIDGVKYHFVSMQEMKRDLALHKFVEAGELNNNLYGTRIDSIKEEAEKGKHCLLNISPKAIKKLHAANIFPIVIFVKPASIESLQEMNKRWTYEEVMATLRYAQRLEQEFGSLFTATIQLDNPNVMLREIYDVLTQQSRPRIWIPTTFENLNVT